jgi:gliding motility-associated-like protein
MKKSLLFLLFLSIPIFGMAQGEATWWFFGENASLDFSSGGPLAGPSGSLFTTEGCSTISDECGNLLFYSDGSQIWDRNGNQMPNGFGLSGNGTSAQSAIIIPDLNNSDVYFVITVYQQLEYSIVNMQLNGGLGDVIPGRKNISLLTSTQEKVTAALNDAGDRYWIVGFDDGGNYYSWIAGGGLVNTNPASVVNSNIPAAASLTDDRGYLRLSPDGTKIINTSVGDPLVMCDFDDATGVVSNPITLTNPGSTSDEFYGAEFSPDSNLLYINANSANGGNGNISNNSKQLLQYDTRGGTGWNNSPIVISTDVGEGRGALQLGIDGKLYHARTYTNFLGVVNDPNVQGLGCNYNHTGVTVPTGMRVREGLPPFITSFFTPDFLATDANAGTGGGNNNPQTEFCDGTPIQFNSSGTGLCAAAVVSWDFGDGTTSTTFDPIHTFPGPGSYIVVLTVTSGFYSTTATDIITIYEIPNANNVPDVLLCDGDGDNAESFDVSLLDGTVIGTQTNPNFQVSWHTTLAGAQNNTNIIPAGLSNYNIGTTTVYARIQNGASAFSVSCFETVAVDIIVDTGITATQPDDLIICDTDNDGLANFDLTVVEPQVLNGLTPSQFTISYHLTAADATSNTNPIATPSNYPISVAYTAETIYVRMQDNNPSGCNSTTSFVIDVFDTPIANPVSDIALCDIGNDNSENYDLSQLTATLRGSQVYNASSIGINFYDNQADADARNNELPLSYNVTATTTIYARVENGDNNDCYAIETFDISLDTTPVANTTTEFRLCDDATNDGAEDFDLTTKLPEILGSQNPTAFNIEFFVTQAGADLGSAGGASPLATTHNSGTATIFVRIENIANTNCYDTTTLDLIVDAAPAATAPSNLIICDDISNDGVEDVILSQFDADVLNGQTNPDFAIAYFATQTDADADTNPLSSPFSAGLGTNTIVARVDNINNEDCYQTASFDIILNVQAIANTITEYRICDDITNDGLADFDLNTKTPEILGSQSATDFNVEYFASQADANLGSVGGATPIASPFNTGDTTLFVRIENNANTDCYDTTTIDLFVDDLPIAGTPADIIVCDDPSNDGVEDVDLSQFDADILNGQSSTSFVVSYHASQADADADSNPLASPYSVSASTPNLFARIDNGDNNDCYTTTSFQFVISSTPTANNVQDMITCDDPGNDGSEIFDLSQADVEVLGTQPAADFTITYHPSQADADANTNALPTTYASATTTPETIFVRIENNTNTQCFDTTSFTLTVSAQPTAGTAPDQRGCDDPSNDGVEDFDFTNVDGDILNGQNPADFVVTYHTSQADADNGVNALTFPYSNVSSPQTIYARIENRTNANCYDTSDFDIEVFARPTIANQGPITICAGVDETLDAGPGYSSYLWSTGDTTQTITVNTGGVYDVTVTNADGCDTTASITVIESDAATIVRIDVDQFEVNTNQLTAIVTGSGDYEYSLDDFVYQSSPRFNNLYPGFYTVYVRDRNGCGTVSMDAVIIGGPPYFTPNQDGFHDFWQVIAIETVPDASIYIFDRYGKLLKQIDPQGPGWDGTYNGNPMPSSDYWYLVELSDGRSFKGHFALKR